MGQASHKKSEVTCLLRVAASGFEPVSLGLLSLREARGSGMWEGLLGWGWAFRRRVRQKRGLVGTVG